VGMALGVEDGIVSLMPNDDIAMGAPPGAIDAGGPLMRDTVPRLILLLERVRWTCLWRLYLCLSAGRCGRVAITPAAARGAHRDRI
jgi:hypothetical protein